MKNKKYFIALVLIICFALLLSAKPQEKKDNPRAKIATKNSEFCKLFNARDKGFDEFFDEQYCRPETKTVILLRPGYENKIASKQELKKFWKGLMARGVKDLKFKTTKIEFCGDDFAIEYGTISYTLSSPSGEDLDPQCCYQNGWCHRDDCEWFFEYGAHGCEY